jgi:hypothetical protein
VSWPPGPLGEASRGGERRTLHEQTSGAMGEPIIAVREPRGRLDQRREPTRRGTTSGARKTRCRPRAAGGALVAGAGEADVSRVAHECTSPPSSARNAAVRSVEPLSTMITSYSTPSVTAASCVRQRRVESTRFADRDDDRAVERLLLGCAPHRLEELRVVRAARGLFAASSA